MSNDRTKANRPVRAAMLLAAVTGTALLGAPVSAQKLTSTGLPSTDPIIAWGEQLAPRNEFLINSDDDTEVVRYKTPHDIELCAGKAHTNADGHVRGYPIKATWDGETATITPGNCLAFDARSVKVRAATDLPQGIVLTGTFRVTK